MPFSDREREDIATVRRQIQAYAGDRNHQLDSVLEMESAQLMGFLANTAEGQMLIAATSIAAEEKLIEDKQVEQQQQQSSADSKLKEFIIASAAAQAKAVIAGTNRVNQQVSSEQVAKISNATSAKEANEAVPYPNLDLPRQDYQQLKDSFKYEEYLDNQIAHIDAISKGRDELLDNSNVQAASNIIEQGSQREDNKDERAALRKEMTIQREWLRADMGVVGVPEGETKELDSESYHAAKLAEEYLHNINVALLSDEEHSSLSEHLNGLEGCNAEEIKEKFDDYYDKLGGLGLASQSEIDEFKKEFNYKFEDYQAEVKQNGGDVFSDSESLSKFQQQATELRSKISNDYGKRTLLSKTGEKLAKEKFSEAHFVLPEGQKALFAEGNAYFFDEKEDVKFGEDQDGGLYLDDNNDPYLIQSTQKVVEDKDGRYLLNSSDDLANLSPEEKVSAAKALIDNQDQKKEVTKQARQSAERGSLKPGELAKKNFVTEKLITRNARKEVSPLKRDFGIMRGAKNLGASAVLGAKQVGQAGLKGAAKGASRLAVTSFAAGTGGVVAGVYGGLEGMAKGAYTGVKDGYKNAGVLGVIPGVGMGMVGGIFTGAANRFAQVMEGTDKFMSEKVESRYMNYGTITGAYDDVVKAQDSLQAAQQSELDAEAQLIALEEELIGCGPNDDDHKDKLEGLIEDQKIVKGEATAERMAQEVNVDKAEKHFRTFDLKDSNKAKVVKGKDPEATERAQKYFATSTSVSASQRLKSRLSSDDPSAKNKVNLYSARVKLREAVKNHKKAQTEVSLAKENLRRANGGPTQPNPAVISNAKADLQAAQALEVKAKGDVSSAAKEVSQARLKVKGIEPAAAKPAAKKGARSISSRFGFGKKAKVAPNPLVQAQKQVVNAQEAVMMSQATVMQVKNRELSEARAVVGSKIQAAESSGKMGPATKLELAKNLKNDADINKVNALLEQPANLQAIIALADDTKTALEKAQVEFDAAKDNITPEDEQQAQELGEAYEILFEAENELDDAKDDLAKEQGKLDQENEKLAAISKLESGGYEQAALPKVEVVELVEIDAQEKALLDANQDPVQRKQLTKERDTALSEVTEAKGERASKEGTLGKARDKLTEKKEALLNAKNNFTEKAAELKEKQVTLAQNPEAPNAKEEVDNAKKALAAALLDVNDKIPPYAEALDNELAANNEYIEAFNKEQAAIDDYNAEVEVQLANADEANIRQAMAQKKTADEARVNQEKQAEATAKKQQAEEQQRAKQQGNQDIIKNIPKGAAKDAVTKIATSEANNGFKAKESKHKGGASYSIDASASTKEGKRVSVKDAISVDLKQDGTGNISINAETWQNARSNPAQLDALREGFVSHTLKLAEDQGWDEVDLKTTGPNAIPKDQIDRIVEDMQKDGLAITVDGKAHKPAVLNKPSVEGKKSPAAPTPTNKGTPNQKAPEPEAPKSNKEKFRENVAKRAQEIISDPQKYVGKGATVPQVSMLQAIKQAANEELQEMQKPKDNQNPNTEGIEQGLTREQNGDTILLDDRDMRGIAAMIKQDSGRPSALPNQDRVKEVMDDLNGDIKDVAEGKALSAKAAEIDTAQNEEDLEQERLNTPSMQNVS